VVVVVKDHQAQSLFDGTTRDAQLTRSLMMRMSLTELISLVWKATRISEGRPSECHFHGVPENGLVGPSRQVASM
jgi:hypothetical protein